MSDKSKGVVIALGYFDSVHLGHRIVISKAKQIAKQFNLKTVIFTFEGNLKNAVKGSLEGVVYTLEERLSLYKSVGIEDVCLAPVTKEFLSLNAQGFLDWLNQKFNIKAYVFGKDYRFGKGGEGTPEFISEYAKAHSQTATAVEIYKQGEKKVSTTLIKELLSKGDILSANNLLGKNYFIRGEVFSDRKVGKQLGFPTINIKINKEKFALKNGVYSGSVNVDGVDYKAIINYGARPTFDLQEKLIEAHLIGFDGDLYGKTLSVGFIDFLRDIKKFNSLLELKEQLQKDLEIVKGNNK